ncbi:MAG: DUF374 domain-containing protein [Thermodesulfobacteriota bacterium]
MKAFLNKAGFIVIPFIAYLFIKFLELTMRSPRINYEGYRKITDEGKNIILTFWHGRLLMIPAAYEGEKVTVLISSHRDGEYVARTMHRLGIETSRGSSTRGWMHGIKGMLKAARSGRDLAIAPDGPKGPPRKAQMGVIQLARKTGMPIIPITYSAAKKKLLRAGTLLYFRTFFQRAYIFAEIPS